MKRLVNYPAVFSVLTFSERFLDVIDDVGMDVLDGLCEFLERREIWL